jgi:hypothetical protein
MFSNLLAMLRKRLHEDKTRPFYIICECQKYDVSLII